jgi:hypothetical protein
MEEMYHDSSLPYASRSNKGRIILGPTTENLNGPSDFIISTDDRVKFAFLGEFSEVNGVLFECFSRLRLLAEVEAEVVGIVAA